MTDSFSRRSAALVGLRFCFIALKVFEVDNDSPCQLLTVITDTKTMQMSAMKACFQIAECSLSYAKLRNGVTECKSIHNRLQSVYNPFIPFAIHLPIFLINNQNHIMNDVKISIHDSIVQVLPNATKAVQNFYGDQFAEQILSKQEAAEDSPSDAESPEVDSPEARKLVLYIGEECLPAFLAQIRDCNNATELALVVVSMFNQETKLTEEIVVRSSFIQLLLPFAIKITSGRSVNNVRARINDALIARRKSHPKH